MNDKTSITALMSSFGRAFHAENEVHPVFVDPLARELMTAEEYDAVQGYKVRAALLPVPLNTPMPTGAMTRSLWYVAVRSGDVHRVQHYLRTERDN